jgi:hypothetical protein
MINENDACRNDLHWYFKIACGKIASNNRKLSYGKVLVVIAALMTVLHHVLKNTVKSTSVSKKQVLYVCNNIQ